MKSTSFYSFCQQVELYDNVLTHPSNQGGAGLTVNPVLGILASRYHESVLASASFGAT